MAQATAGAALARLHMEQWQIAVMTGAPVTSYRTAPHEELLAQGEGAGPGDPSEHGDVHDADRDHGVGGAGAAHREHGDREQDRGERAQDVHQPPEGLVEPAAARKSTRLNT